MNAAPYQLQERAAALYPRSPYLQAAWIRAVLLVRGTTRGWVLERPL